MTALSFWSRWARPSAKAALVPLAISLAFWLPVEAEAGSGVRTIRRGTSYSPEPPADFSYSGAGTSSDPYTQTWDPYASSGRSSSSSSRYRSSWSSRSSRSTRRGSGYRGGDERQTGGSCIYGLNGELLHKPDGKECASNKVAQAAAGKSASSPEPKAAARAACVSGECRNGYGTYDWANGTLYVGGFKNGRQNGYGTLILADGGSYVGDWVNGKRSGNGVAMSADGRAQSGLWKDDRFLGAGAGAATPAIANVKWPDLLRPASKVGGGKRDAAVIIGIENYAYVAKIPRATDNASAWYNYFVHTRNVPVENVALLLDEDATLEEMRFAAENAAKQVKKGGSLWYVFIGHGAPAKDGDDGLLVGFDAQQKARSIEARSLARSELLALLEESGAGKVNVLLDACFSGRIGSGEQLVAGLQPLVVSSLRGTADPRMTVMTAARSDEYAGPLPGAGRPAFSYLALGALRGWADGDGNGRVTAVELHGYVSRAMQALVRDRRQRPTLAGRSDADLARSPREKGPDLSALVLRAARGGFGPSPN